MTTEPSYGKPERTELRRKRTERALLESEELLKKAQEIAHLGSWELDVVNNQLSWSDEVYRIFGLEPQEFAATYEAFLERVHPDDRKAVDDAYSSSLREGRDTYEIEHRVVRRSTGEIRHVHEKCEHIRDASGKIVGSIGMVHDITERKRAEEDLQKAKEDLEFRVQEKTAELAQSLEELRRSEEKFRLIAETVQDVFWMMKPDSDEILYVNPAYREVWGRSTESLIRDPSSLFQTIHPEDRERVGLAKKNLPGQACEDLEYRIFKPDGSVRWIRELCYPIREENQVLLVGVARDITERKERKDQLRYLSAQLLDAQERERRNVAVELHDRVGESLIGIKMAVEEKLREIRERKSPMEGAALEEVLELVKKCMRDSSRIQQELRPSVLDHLGLTSALHYLCRNFKTKHEDIRTTCTLEIDETNVPEELKIIVFRISQEALANAAKHSGAKNVRIFVTQRDDEILLTIQDDGCGFDTEQALRGGNTCNGIGLSAMRERCEFSGGSFSVHSRSGDGTTLRCSWPCGV